MYHLRRASENDFDFVLSLFKTVYEDYIIKFWSGRDDEFQKHFYESRFKPERIQVILNSEKEIGVLELIEKGRQIYIEEIQIEPDSQGRGIGTKIINDIKKTAFELNCSVGLQVLKSNRAKKLYERLGFTIIGETETHYIMETINMK